MPQQSRAQAAPLRVLLVHCRYQQPGGEDAVFEAERRLLEEAGCAVFTLEASNAWFHGLRKALLPLAFLGNPFASLRLRRLVRAQRIDLVHVHNTFFALSPSVIRAAKACGVPVVQTLHNFRLLCPNGIFLRPGAVPTVCERCPQNGLLEAVRGSCYRGSALGSLLAGAALRLHRALGTWRGVWSLAPTDFDRALFARYNSSLGILDGERLLTKPHPVSGGEQQPLPLAARETQFVFAGRFEELKGLRTLLLGWQLLAAQEGPCPRLVLAGSGPLEAWARSFAQANRLPVTFAGRLGQEELHDAMRRSLGTVVPSLCYESFGLTAAESLLCGTPVVGSDLGNTGAMIQNGVNGLAFAPGSPEALAEAVAQVPALWQQLRPDAIQAEAAARYAPRKSLEALLQVYTAAMAAQQKDAL